MTVSLSGITECEKGLPRYGHLSITFLRGRQGDITDEYRCPPTAEEIEANSQAERLAVQIIKGKGINPELGEDYVLRSAREPDWVRVTGIVRGPPYDWSVYLKSVNGQSVVRYAGTAEEPYVAGVPCDLAVGPGEGC